MSDATRLVCGLVASTSLWLSLLFYPVENANANGARVANTSLALPPDLPSGTFSTTNAFPGLLFTDPVAIVTPPGESNRLFIVEQIGRIALIPDLSTPSKEIFLDITSIVRSSNNEEGLLGLAFHPNYNNAGEVGYGQFFVYFQINVNNQRHWRLSRFQVDSNNPDRGDASSELPIITQRDQNGNHNGGDLHFGDDGYLYISVGDEGGANDTRDNGQHIDKDFFAAIFRIDVDQKEGSLDPNSHAAIHANTYKVPPGNPFVGATSFNGSAVNPSSVRTEIWAIGLRNPWRMSFDRPTGRWFVADVGQGAREEINVMSASVFAGNGGVPNYGWSFREGFLPFTNGPGGATPPVDFSAIDPIHDYPRSEGRSVTGGLVYRGSSYPELLGDYLFADYATGRIWAMDDPGGPNQSVTQIAIDNQIAGFGIDPSTGDVLLADDNSNRTNDDQIKRLVRAEGSGESPPDRLSLTGAFSDLTALIPEDGIVAYDINHPFWSDEAVKRRWFSVPELADQMAWSQDETWSFPEGQVWIKHFDLDLNRDNPGTNVRRLETRFLVKTADDVYGITYRWNDEQDEAFLVDADGFEEAFSITENGETISQTWTYPSRADCRTCHTPVSGFALGFNTRQLNKEFESPLGSGNQIAELESAGYFSNDPPEPATLPAFVAIDDFTASLTDRARSYLAANCVGCHQPGGPSLGEWNARPDIALAEAGIIDGESVNNGGDPLNRILVPGLPERSMLLKRLDAVGDHSSSLSAMPPVATSVKNQVAIDLMTSWIESLKKILFIRGGDRTGGFLEANDDAGRTEQLADINNESNANRNHGWKELADTLRGEGYTVEQLTEGSETGSGPAAGIPIDFESLDLNQYHVIVFGSNNAVYDTGDIDAVDAWVRGGGAALFISDANFGGDWADAPNSDQQFLDRFGLIMNQDRGTYSLSRSSGDFLVPDHPVFESVDEFHGEGVSPISVGTLPADVSVSILAKAKNQVRRNVAPFGDENQGGSTEAAAQDGSLVAGTAGMGRIAGHFDRNTFFNDGGAGSDITRFDNRQYAINLFDWLARGIPPDPFPAAPISVSASSDSRFSVLIGWNSVPGGVSGYEIYRSTENDVLTAAEVGQTTSNQFVDSAAPIGVPLFYWVRAFAGVQDGNWSDPAEGYRRSMNYAEFMSLFSLTGDDALPAADPNGDGILNLESAAADIDPENSDSRKQSIVLFERDEANQKMVLIFRRIAGGLHGVDYRIMRSLDLDQWTQVDFTAPDNTQVILADDPDGDGSAEWVRVEVEFSPGEDREFLKIDFVIN